jgi:hypothetical protein
MAAALTKPSIVFIALASRENGGRLRGAARGVKPLFASWLFPNIGKVLARFFQGLEKFGRGYSKPWKKCGKVFQALENGLFPLWFAPSANGFTPCAACRWHVGC